MARNDWDDDDDDNSGQESNLVKDLRKQLKEALKARDDLTTQVADLSKANRSTALKDVLTSKKLNPKLVAFYPADGEATPEAVEAWVKEYADVFGIQTQDEDTAQTVLSPDAVQGFQALNSVQGDNPQVLAKQADLQAKLRAATTPEEVAAVLAQI